MERERINHLIKSYVSAYLTTLKSRQYQPLSTQWKLHKQRLLKEIEQHEQWHLLRDLCLLMMYYGTPIRAQELCEMELEQVIINSDGKIHVKVHADDHERYILLDEDSIEILREYMALVQPDQLYLFLSDDKQPFSSNEIFLLTTRCPNEVLASELSSYFPIYSNDDYEIIPTPLRLNSMARYSGRDVTIAFVDSGFYPHPDLVMPNNRILAYVNIPEPDKEAFDIPDQASWHGMQTSVSAAGNGYLSDGLYKGIAYNANVVLLRVTDSQGEIKTEYMIKALKWVLVHQQQYNIKIVNISLGESHESSYLDNALDQIAEALVQAGVVVVVAAGNDGHRADSGIFPPASAPSVITVGGFDDKNRLSRHYYDMYHSSYGPTIDGLMKPELLAPGIWVAAPILPKTPLYEEAELLSKLRRLPDEALIESLRDNQEALTLAEALLEEPLPRIRAAIAKRLREQKIVGGHYQHVDGTSFSAPIVCAIIAQMLEANPALSPRRIKQILISTTDKIFNIPIEKQGHGLIHPRKVVKEAENDRYRRAIKRMSSPHVQGRKVSFFYEDGEAQSVALVGDFTDWKSDKVFLQRRPGSRLWELEKEFPFKGIYSYKFVIDNQRWIPDPECDNLEPDGYGGLNTRLNLFLD